MNSLEVFESLKDYMINFHDAKISSGGKEINKRCHLCGDSRDPKSRHMYIGIHKESGLIVYNCFKCNESGIVDSKFIRELGDYDNYDLANACNKYNNEILSKPGNIIIKNLESNKFNNPKFFIRDCEESKRKLLYVNNRLGSNLSYDDMSRLKIILNLYDFLNVNRIEKLSRHPLIVEQLDKYFIGFLSVDNSYINMRKLVPEGKVHPNIDKKYVNYNIFGKINNSQRYYIIPGSINMLEVKPVKIYVSEGPFDNLSIYHNVVQDKYNSIFANIGGKSYLNIAKFFIQTYGLINIEYHIYPDADVDNYEIYKLANYLSPFNISIYMHRNICIGEKDYGVPLSRIIDNKIKIN